MTRETYLPLDLSAGHTDEKGEEQEAMQADYLIEPSPEQVMEELLPKVLRMKMYTVLLDSTASEHAARTMAMQIATDNANDLIQELTLIYNKSRQQAITNELLDIVGGSMSCPHGRNSCVHCIKKRIAVSRQDTFFFERIN